MELQTRQQQLIAARNDFAKQKLSLARTIGLPLGQEFTLTDTAPVRSRRRRSPWTMRLQQAYATRADFQSALAQVRAAEYARRAATAEHLPSLSAYADYGVDRSHTRATHGTFTRLCGACSIPIFAGNKAHGDALVADADLDAAASSSKIFARRSSRTCATRCSICNPPPIK